MTSNSLDRLRALSPSEFESLIAKVFSSLGWSIEITGRPGDGGIDLVLTRPGEKAIAQCKRFVGTVGQSVVRDFFGALVHSGATRGYLVSTGLFSLSALAWAHGKEIVLVDGPDLVSALDQLPEIALPLGTGALSENRQTGAWHRLDQAITGAELNQMNQQMMPPTLIVGETFEHHDRLATWIAARLGVRLDYGLNMFGYREQMAADEMGVWTWDVFGDFSPELAYVFNLENYPYAEAKAIYDIGTRSRMVDGSRRGPVHLIATCTEVERLHPSLRKTFGLELATTDVNWDWLSQEDSMGIFLRAIACRNGLDPETTLRKWYALALDLAHAPSSQDDLLVAQRADLLGRVTALAQDLLAVLAAEGRRAPDRGLKAREREGPAHQSWHVYFLTFPDRIWIAIPDGERVPYIDGAESRPNKGFESLFVSVSALREATTFSDLDAYMTRRLSASF